MKKNLLLLPILSIGTILGMYFWIAKAYHSAVLDHDNYVLEKSGVSPSYFDLYSDFQIDSIIEKKTEREKIYWEVYITENSQILLRKSLSFKKNSSKEPIVLLLSKGRIVRLFVENHIFGTFYFMRHELLAATCFSLVYVLSLLMFIKFYKQYQLTLQLKESFIANITHELKTPVTAINATIELLEDFDVAKLPEKRTFYLHRIRKESTRLMSLIETLIEISLSKSEISTSKKENINITEIIKSVIHECSERIKEKEAIVDFMFSSEKIIAKGVSSHIRNVISVILDNALKYSNGGVKITIDHIITTDKLFIRISDTGIGIPQEYKSYIFKKFFRDPSSIKRGIKGHGLGLFYARELIRYCNGDITYSPLQKGSCFSIILPIK